jgi:hypothetical protein
MTRDNDETIRPECKAYFADGTRRMQEISDNVNKLVTWIEGNGQPGIKVRIDRLEQAHKTLTRLTWVTVTSVVGAIIVYVVKAVN